MFCYLFYYLSSLDIPGMGVFKYISFRSSLAFISSLLIATIIGRKIIDFLQKKQVGETIRDLDLAGQMAKKAHDGLKSNQRQIRDADHKQKIFRFIHGSTPPSLSPIIPHFWANCKRWFCAIFKPKNVNFGSFFEF